MHKITNGIIKLVLTYPLKHWLACGAYNFCPFFGNDTYKGDFGQLSIKSSIVQFDTKDLHECIDDDTLMTSRSSLQLVLSCVDKMLALLTAADRPLFRSASRQTSNNNLQFLSSAVRHRSTSRTNNYLFVLNLGKWCPIRRFWLMSRS
jgi:hypothetical protein